MSTDAIILASLIVLAYIALAIGQLLLSSRLRRIERILKDAAGDDQPRVAPTVGLDPVYARRPDD